MEFWLALGRVIRTAGILLLAALGVILCVPPMHRIIAHSAFDLLLFFAFVWVLGATFITLKLRSSAPRGLFLLLFLFVGIPTALWIFGVRWDLLVRTPAHVTVDGHPFPKARVYRGWRGETAIFLNELGSPDVYIPELHDVIFCDPALFHDYGILGRLEKSRDEYLCMSSEKEEIKIDLQVTPDALSFNHRWGSGTERVTVRR